MGNPGITGAIKPITPTKIQTIPNNFAKIGWRIFQRLYDSRSCLDMKVTTNYEKVAA